MLFVVSAPSGAGKTTVVTAVINDLGQLYPIKRVVTYTSREPRQGEVHGIDYFFVSTTQFQELIEQDFFMEWSVAYGTYYGSPRSVLEAVARGDSYIMVLDRDGVASLVAQEVQAIFIWIDVPSIDALKERLRARKSETPEQLATRIALAQSELATERINPIYHHRIVNDQLAVAVAQLKEIVQQFQKTF